MGWFSDLFKSDKKTSVAKSYTQAADYYKSLVPPSLANTAMELERMVSAGEITPVQAQNYLLEKSAMEGITIDPKLYNAQLDALTSLQDISKSGGLTAMDRAQLNDINIEEQVKERGAREAILNNQAARGLAGSGQELAQQLISQQSSADRIAQRGTEVAGMAQKRALEAIQNAGSLAGNMRTQSFGEQSAKAAAADAIAKFNASMKAQTSATNAAAANDAQAQNIANNLKVQAANLSQGNTEEANRIEQQNKLYEQQLQKAQGQANAYLGLGGAQTEVNKNNQNTTLSGITTIADNWEPIADAAKTAWNWFSDEEVKVNKRELSDDQVNDLLDSLTGYSYKYDKAHGGEPGVGVMAQDLEKTPLEDNVVDTPNGKMVKGDPEMLSAMMAALANINKRVNGLEGK